MGGPWEKYAEAAPTGGKPWEAYAQSEYRGDTSGRNVSDMRNEFINQEGSLKTRIKEHAKGIPSLAEIPRFGAEMVTMPLNAGLRGLKSVASTVQAGGEAIRQGSLDAGLQKYAEKQAEFQPLNSPLQPSATGQIIGDVAGAGINKLSDLTGRPDIVEPVAQGMMDIGALAGLRAALPAVTRGVKAAPGALADLNNNAVVKPIANVAKTGIETLRENSRQKFETQKLDTSIDTAYTKAVRPTVGGKKNINQIENSKGVQRDAVKTIVENKDILGLETENGLPSNLMEFSQAIKAAKDKVFKDYDAMKAATGENGVVIDLTPIAAELKSIADNKVLLDQKPQVAEYLKKRAAVLEKRGSYTTAEMQDAVKIYNADLKAFYKNPSPQYAAQAAIDARIVDAMRKSLDESITGEVGAGYQGLKNQYGSLTSIEGEVAQRAIVDARKNPAGLLDFTDIATSGEALTGLLTGNPMMVIKGVAGRGIKEWIKHKNSPDAMVSKMFKTVDKYYTRRKDIEIPPSRANYPKQPMVYDPSTGTQIPARNMPSERVPLGDYGPSPTNNTVPRVPLNDNGPAPVNNTRPRIPMNDYGPGATVNNTPRVPLNGGGGQPKMIWDATLRQMIPRNMGR